VGFVQLKNYTLYFVTVRIFGMIISPFLLLESRYYLEENSTFHSLADRDSMDFRTLVRIRSQFAKDDVSPFRSLDWSNSSFDCSYIPFVAQSKTRSYDFISLPLHYPRHVCTLQTYTVRHVACGRNPPKIIWEYALRTNFTARSFPHEAQSKSTI
jgi:hypothetical protein